MKIKLIKTTVSTVFKIELNENLLEASREARTLYSKDGKPEYYVEVGNDFSVSDYGISVTEPSFSFPVAEEDVESLSKVLALAMDKIEKIEKQVAKEKETIDKAMSKIEVIEC